MEPGTYAHKKKKDDASSGSSGRASHRRRMVLTERDVEVVRWVHSAPLATREQLQRLFFTEGGRTRAQHRLALLVRHRYLDTLPDRSINEPAVYYLSRRATKGLSLLRRIADGATVAPFRIAQVRVQHTLDIASVRIALLRACAVAGFEMPLWRPEPDLLPITGPFGLLPDGYLHLNRVGEDRPRFPFFIEVERSSKSRAALEDRFRKYGDFFYDGGYEAAFGERGLRVLFLVGAEYGLRPSTQIAKCLEICEQANVTMLRFAPLQQFLDTEPCELLYAPIWHQPLRSDLMPLVARGDAG